MNFLISPMEMFPMQVKKFSFAKLDQNSIKVPNVVNNKKNVIVRLGD